MDTSRQFPAVLVLLGAMSVAHADGMLNERAAIDVAKRTLKDQCTSVTPCTFSAAREKANGLSVSNSPSAIHQRTNPSHIAVATRRYSLATAVKSFAGWTVNEA